MVEDGRTIFVSLLNSRELPGALGEGLYDHLRITGARVSDEG